MLNPRPERVAANLTLPDPMSGAVSAGACDDRGVGVSALTVLCATIAAGGDMQYVGGHVLEPLAEGEGAV